MAILAALDHQLFFAIHHLQKFNLDFLLGWPNFLGSLWYVLPLLGLFIFIKKRCHFLPYFFAAAAPIIIARIGADIIKILVQRPRPFMVFSEQPDAVRVILDRPDSFSFPSGHASTAFATAVILSAWFGVPRAVIYSLAVLIGLTRIYIGVHFPSDILVGALWGFTLATLWVQYLENRGFKG